MSTGSKIRCEYCGRVYKEPATGIIACPACGGPYGIEIGSSMYEPYRRVARYPVMVSSDDAVVFCDTGWGGFYST